jgi:hypothetical protein
MAIAGVHDALGTFARAPFAITCEAKTERSAAQEETAMWLQKR